MNGYFSNGSCDIADFARHVDQKTDIEALKYTDEAQHNIPIYDATTVPLAGENRQALMAEWANVLLSGAGVVVIKNAYADTTCLDKASTIYEKIIAAEKAEGQSNADHFAAGTNDRIWNSLQKLCLTDPSVFEEVFSRPAIDTVCEAWLGPNYQMTTQVNLVYPGGAAQQAHRDYHLGFQTAETAAAYPAHVHDLSPVMTLQGAIAHCDMSVESGPTKLLPFSQSYRPGYLAYRLPAFRDYFEENCVQLPLNKGDTLFFNPALFHAAGENRTEDVNRLVNLLQVGTAMGRTLENVDRIAMCKALYPSILESAFDGPDLKALIAATAEGYPFPTNLDTDPPEGGLAPASQADLLRNAIATRQSPAEFGAALDAQTRKQRA